MERVVFNPAQREILDVMSCMQTDEDLQALKAVLVQFLNDRLQRELDRLWENGTIDEKKMDEFDFSGNLDICEFIKIAGEEGLLAIVRPGPYICAEWEFGGLPWWLQTLEDMEIRCQNKTYMERFEKYLSALFEQIRPYLVTNGGNIIMLQCENEYGYYGDDKEYLKKLYEIYRSYGIDVPLFTSDGTGEEDLRDGTIEGCLPTLNFGSRVEENFRAHDKLFPNSPKMCMEMWNG